MRMGILRRGKSTGLGMAPLGIPTSPWYSICGRVAHPSSAVSYGMAWHGMVSSGDSMMGSGDAVGQMLKVPTVLTAQWAGSEGGSGSSVSP